MAAAVVEMDTEAEQMEKISYGEVETWCVDALKDYCRKRGYRISGSKKELVARVYVLYNNNAEELPGARVKELSRKKDYKEIYSAQHIAPDPMKLENWVKEKSGMKNWPPVTYVDVDIFMRKHGSVGLSSEGLTAYKTGKAYSYFSCDWLHEVFYHPITKKHQCCYLKANCLPSNRINDSPHSLWIKTLKTGEVVSAYCSCVAG